jgi:4-oxalocrotonate tautomerase
VVQSRHQDEVQQEVTMPIVRVEMFSGRTHAQKQELARAITEAVANIAHTTPEATIVIFQDIERENWAEAGKLASDD